MLSRILYYHCHRLYLNMSVLEVSITLAKFWQLQANFSEVLTTTGTGIYWLKRITYHICYKKSYSHIVLGLSAPNSPPELWFLIAVNSEITGGSFRCSCSYNMADQMSVSYQNSGKWTYLESHLHSGLSQAQSTGAKVACRYRGELWRWKKVNRIYRLHV